jgi:AcrR family transcriptional regulator
VAAARALFLEPGFDAVSVREIADKHYLSLAGYRLPTV